MIGSVQMKFMGCDDLLGMSMWNHGFLLGQGMILSPTKRRFLFTKGYPERGIDNLIHRLSQTFSKSPT
jgi:hypothetical protein